MDEEKTIKEELREIKQAIKEQKKKKKFRMPLSVRMQKGKFKKKDYAIVCFIQTNGAVTFKVMKIEDNTIKIREKFYSATAKDVLRYKGKPLLIITQWNMEPFSPEKDFEKAKEEGTLTAAQGLILTKMKMEAIKGKLQLNWKIILIIGALLIGLFWLLDYLKVI